MHRRPCFSGVDSMAYLMSFPVTCTRSWTKWSFRPLLKCKSVRSLGKETRARAGRTLYIYDVILRASQDVGILHNELLHRQTIELRPRSVKCRSVGLHGNFHAVVERQGCVHSGSMSHDVPMTIFLRGNSDPVAESLMMSLLGASANISSGPLYAAPKVSII